jgi:stage V sporulation protein B
VSFKTLLRIALAMAAAIAVGTRLPWYGRPFLLLEAAVVAGVFVLVSALLGELSLSDWARVRHALGRKRS